MAAPEKKVLTIERAKWRRGGESSELNARFGQTALLNTEGFMCCLGFDALACGVPEDSINGTGEPSDIPDLYQYPDYARKPRFAAHRDDNDGVEYLQSAAVGRAMAHNDDPALLDPEREALIREDLIALGWDDVVFV